MNPWEASARSAKVQRLVESVDNALPHAMRNPESAFAAVENLGDAGWASMAACANVSPASAETRALVVSCFARRVRASVDAQIAASVAGALIHFSRDAQGLDVIEVGPGGPSCPCSRCQAKAVQP